MHNILLFTVIACFLVITSNNNNSGQGNEEQSNIKAISTNASSNFQPASMQQSAIEICNISENDIVLGNINSNVVVVEYFSPSCPTCAYYNKNILPVIKKKYIDTNKIAYIVREFISNRQDLDAAILARCNGDNDSFLKFQSIILEQQDKWIYSNRYHESLITIAQTEGISAESYQKCYNNNQIVTTLITNTNLVSKVPPFIGTPAFFVNGIQVTIDRRMKALSATIDKFLKTATNS